MQSVRKAYLCHMRQLVQITPLPHGITVASERMPGAYSVSVGLWVCVGSANEQPSTNGVSHFFEHMVFKGTKNRSALQIAHEIEERGGNLNAYTTREQTCFYARTVHDDFALGLDTICDLAMNPRLEQAEIDKERKVIIEEIRSYEDSPDELAHDLFCARHFGKTGLSYPITGTAKTVKLVGQKELQAHQRDVLRKHPIFIVASGNVNHEELVGQVREMLAAKRGGAEEPMRHYAGHGGGSILKRKDVSQSNVVAGTSIQSRAKGHQRLSLTLFNILFGDGMSSRLFQKVREDHALAYSIYSAVDNFQGCRSFNIALGTDPKRQQKALDLIHGEIRTLLKDGLRPGELERAKTSVLGGIKLGLDSPSNRMNRLARQLIRSGTFTPFSALQKELAQVTPQDVMAVVEEIFMQGTWSAAAVLPKEAPTLDCSPLLSFR